MEQNGDRNEEAEENLLRPEEHLHTIREESLSDRGQRQKKSSKSLKAERYKRLKLPERHRLLIQEPRADSPGSSDSYKNGEKYLSSSVKLREHS